MSQLMFILLFNHVISLEELYSLNSKRSSKGNIFLQRNMPTMRIVHRVAIFKSTATTVYEIELHYNKPIFFGKK